MASSEQERAKRRLDEALAAGEAADPRDVCRERLRALKESDPGAYREGARHYDEVLVPAIASGETDPITAWTEYARRLAELSAPGRTVAIDATGRAVPYQTGAWQGRLVLHLPHASQGRALAVALPAAPSDAQRATRDWLVSGRLKLADGE